MKHSCFPQLCLPGGRSLVQELGRSLTSRPGEISNNAPSILGFPAVRIVGECLLTSDAPDLTTPPHTLHPSPRADPTRPVSAAGGAAVLSGVGHSEGSSRFSADRWL